MRLRHNFIRFLASGAFNTAITYLIYLILLQSLSYQMSYAIAFGSGIILAYALNRYFVFKKSGGRYGLLFVFLIYLFQFGLGMILVSFWVRWINGPESIAPIFSTIISIPIIFLMNSLVFKRIN